MATDFLRIEDPAVQEFLWKYLVPQDVGERYSKIDAIRYITDEIVGGRMWLIGDLDRQVVFRCVAYNSRVIEPNVMGNAFYIRSVFRDALPLAWSLGVEKVMVWTQHKSLGAIVENLGFRQEGHFTRMHLVDGELLDLFVYSLERQQ